MSALAWALVLGTIRASVELSDRTEARVRNDEVNKPVIDVETAPAVNVELRGRQGTFTVGYLPRFTMMGSNLGPQSLILHALRAGLTWHDRFTSLTFYNDTSYGRQSFAGLPAQTSASGEPVRPDLLPTSGILNYAFSHASFGLEVAPSRLYRFNLGAEYSLSGGLDDISRRTLPFQHGPLFSLGFTYNLSRLDHLTASASISRTWLYAEAGSLGEVFTGATDQQGTMVMDDIILSSTAAWRHNFNRTTESTLTGGIGWARAVHDGNVVTTSVHPVAEASLLHHVTSGRFDLRLDARFSPMVDRWTGEVDERIDYTGSLQWNATRRLSLKGSLGASQPIPPVHLDAPIYVIDSLSLGYQVNRLLLIEGGARSMWSRWVRGDMQPPGTSLAAQQIIAPLTWVSFVAVTATAPSMKF